MRIHDSVTAKLMSAYFARIGKDHPGQRFGIADLAKIVGAATPTVYAWRDGRGRIPADAIATMCHATGMDASVWLCAVEADRSPTVAGRSAWMAACDALGGLPVIDPASGVFHASMDVVEAVGMMATARGIIAESERPTHHVNPRPDTGESVESYRERLAAAREAHATALREYDAIHGTG